jgi:hypothetical protein
MRRVQFLVLGRWACHEQARGCARSRRPRREPSSASVYICTYVTLSSFDSFAIDPTPSSSSVAVSKMQHHSAAAGGIDEIHGNVLFTANDCCQRLPTTANDCQRLSSTVIDCQHNLRLGSCVSPS